MDAYIDVVGGELRTLLETKALIAEGEAKLDVQSRFHSNPLHSVDVEQSPSAADTAGAAAGSTQPQPFVPAQVGILLRVQGWIMDLLRPGQWCLAVDKRRAVVVWKASGPPAESILRALRDVCNQHSNFELARYGDTMNLV